jgi:hypothetical protein
MINSFRNTASFGKRQEYIAIAELLRKGYDVYQTLVDDQQIDCIVRLDYKNELKYFDIQIKARSKNAKKQSWGDWPSIKIKFPRNNFIFIFYSEPLEKYWVIPSNTLVNKGYLIPNNDEKDLFNINLSKYSPKKDCHTDNPTFAEFIDNFSILR